jgi:hypothetical protein
MVCCETLQWLIDHFWVLWCRRILPPSSYIFFASVLPALAFGQQLATDTGIQAGVGLWLLQEARSVGPLLQLSTLWPGLQKTL